MRKMELESLQFFKSVADLGSITLAARQLNRVQSNVTTRIKNLEHRLGVQLFHRHGNRLTLSQEGELLRGYAERLLRLSDEAEAAMQVRAPTGPLRLGTLESTAAARLPPVLSQFHRRYPEVLIELVTGSSAALLEKVERYEVDAALISEPFQAMNLATQAVFDEELVLITPLTADAPLNLDYLQRTTMIAFSTGCSYRQLFEAWLTSQGIVPARVLELASYHAIVACVAAGTGIGIMPRSVLQAVHAEHQLNVHPLPPQYARIRTHLVWQPDHHLAVVDAFRHYLAERP